jgi:hypothetical protein
LKRDHLYFLLPSISKAAEVWAWPLKSDAHTDVLKRVLKPVFEQEMQEAWGNRIKDYTQKLSMTYRRVPQGVEWVIKFGKDRRGPMSEEEVASFENNPAYLVDSQGYVWEKTAVLAVIIGFSSATIVRIKAIPRMWRGRMAQLPTTLAHHVWLRCRRDCPDLWPTFMEIDGSGGVGVKMETHYPYMLHIRHIQSVVTSLLAIITNDPAQLGTDGPGIFHVPAPVPAGDGGPGN